MIGFPGNLKLSIDPGKLEPYMAERIQVISHILLRVNRSTRGEQYVLKGGTGLLLCYGLDRFSEDIDLDGIRKADISDEITAGCRMLGKACTIRVAKDTDMVLRYMVDYQAEEASTDHILSRLDTSTILTEFMYMLEEIVSQEGVGDGI